MGPINVKKLERFCKVWTIFISFGEAPCDQQLDLWFRQMPILFLLCFISKEIILNPSLAVCLFLDEDKVEGMACISWNIHRTNTSNSNQTCQLFDNITPVVKLQIITPNKSKMAK